MAFVCQGPPSPIHLGLSGSDRGLSQAISAAPPANDQHSVLRTNPLISPPKSERAGQLSNDKKTFLGVCGRVSLWLLSITQQRPGVSVPLCVSLQPHPSVIFTF